MNFTHHKNYLRYILFSMYKIFKTFLQMCRKPVSVEKLYEHLGKVPVKGSLFLATPNGQPDLHIMHVDENHYDVQYAQSYNAFFTLYDRDSELMQMTLPRSVFTDIVAAETNKFTSLCSLVNHVNIIMNNRKCQICFISFVGFSFDEAVCTSCYMDICKEIECKTTDALCIVCHNEGEDLKDKVVMKTECCGKVLCITCRVKIKSQVIDSKYTIPCPACRQSLPKIPTLCHDDMVKMYSILKLKT